MDIDSLLDRKAQLEVEQLELLCEHHRLENWQIEKENALIQANPVSAGMFTYSGAVIDRDIQELIHRLAIWANNHPGAPITLTINSHGGTVIDGFALYDFLMQLKRKGHHITTVGLGIVASMGAVLLQAGDERVMSPRTWMMLHEVQGVIEGATSEMKNAIRFNERLQGQALDILTERTKWSVRTLKNKWKDDLWLSAHDALKVGLIDKVDGNEAIALSNVEE